VIPTHERVAHDGLVAESINARQIALFGAALLGADALLSAEHRYVLDVRRDVLRNVDRRVHHVRRRARSAGTGLEVALIALVALIAVAGQLKEQRRPRRAT
jgi:hypothetical protein